MKWLYDHFGWLSCYPGLGWLARVFEPTRVKYYK